MKNLFDLTGKNAVVVGGAGGIGQVLAQGLASAGANVILASRNEESLKRAKDEIKAAADVEVSYHTVDACNEEWVELLVKDTAKKYGNIDILVCAQGINKKFPLQEFQAETFRQMLDINVTSIMLCCKHFGAHMIKNGYGKIVILSSVRGKVASKLIGNIGYTTSKGAVDMLTKQVASELGQYGITVNAIAPTITETPMLSALIEQRGGDAYRKSLGDGLPMKRMAMPEDCIGSAVFLASSASDFMTGNILYPDGGLTAVG